MHDPRHIPKRIPLLIPPSGLSGRSQELLSYRMKEFRVALSVVLVALEQEFGQSIGVASHLFAVWKVTASKGDNMSWWVVLTCIWWLSKGRQTMIKRSEVVKLTGLSTDNVARSLYRALKSGYLAKYRSNRHYYLTGSGTRYIEGFYRDVFAVVLALYDDNE